MVLPPLSKAQLARRIAVLVGGGLVVFIALLRVAFYVGLGR